MKRNDFIEELINTLEIDVDIVNIGFHKYVDKYLKTILSFDSGNLSIVLSTSLFNENPHIISKIKDENNLKAVISLPVYNNEDNLLILMFDSDKTLNQFIYIDKSDSLIHKEVKNWKYINDELISEISNSYSDFVENEFSVILDVSDIIQKNKDDYLNEVSLDFDIDTSCRKEKVMLDFDEASKLNYADACSDASSFKKPSVQSFKNKSRSDNKFSIFNDAMYYKKRQDPENLLYKNDKRLIKGDVLFKRISDISNLEYIYSKSDMDSILISSCKQCMDKLIYYNYDINDLGDETFIEITNIDEKVLKDYLYEYLSSANGMGDILYYAKGNEKILIEDIKHLKIPIPPIDDQKEIVNVARESREFFKTVELLKKEYDSNIFDYKHMKNSLHEFKGEISFDENNDVTSMSRSLRHAYKGLIWPLAISYLSATKGGFEAVEKKDNYLVLFEFIAAFNSIILLSGLPENVYLNNFYEIWGDNHLMYKRATFGNWVHLSKNLSKVYKNNSFTSEIDEELLNAISGDKILDILTKVNYIRNDESHSSQTNSFEAEKVINELNIYLEDIFDILDVYSNYKLIYFTGELNTSNNSLKHRVILLNGPCAQPIYDNMIFDTLLQSDCLYLYNPKNNKKLLIKENLMKFSPVDKNKKRWALLIYSNCDKKEFNAYYKCYQSNEKNLKKNITSFEMDILNF